MARLCGIILGEGLYLAAMSLAPLARKERQRAVAGSRELTMRLQNRHGQNMKYKHEDIHILG